MNPTKDSGSLPEENLSQQEFSRLFYPAVVGTGFDTTENLYKVTYNERCWDEVYDPVWKGECVAHSEKQIEFLVELWYRLNPDGSWTCIKGRRKSIQVFIVNTEYCKKGREMVLTQLFEKRLLHEPQILQQFNFEDNDSVWQNAS